MRSRVWTVVALAGLSLGCPWSGESPGDAAPIEEQLLTADRDFATATAERRFEGWMSYFAEDAAKITPGGGVVRGVEAIREWDRSLFDDNSVLLRWEPTEAGAFSDADHGYTVGSFELVRTGAGAEETILATGHYLTIWRRDAEGWRVILDTSLPDPEDAG